MGNVVRRLAASVILLAIASGLFFFAQFLRVKGLDWADKFASVGALFLSVTALALPLAGRMAGWLRGHEQTTEIGLDEAAYDLVLQPQFVS